MTFRCTVVCEEVVLAKLARTLRDLHIRIADHLQIPVERLQLRQVRRNNRWYWEITDDALRVGRGESVEEAVREILSYDDSPTLVDRAV